MPRVQSASQWWLISIGVVAAALVIISVIINVVADDGDADLLPEDTPEGTVQRYLKALAADDPALAFSYISTSQEGCTLENFIQTTEYRRTQDFSATLTRTTTTDVATLVTVKITESEFDPPFGGGGYDFDSIFTLKQEDGVWRFTEPPWPSWCPPQREVPLPEVEKAPTSRLQQDESGVTAESRAVL